MTNWFSSVKKQLEVTGVLVRDQCSTMSAPGDAPQCGLCRLARCTRGTTCYPGTSFFRIGRLELLVFAIVVGLVTRLVGRLVVADNASVALQTGNLPQRLPRWGQNTVLGFGQITL